MTNKIKIVVLGGGFGGIYAAMELEKQFKNDANVEITLVNQENFLLFTPMLHEVAASDLDPTDIVNPIHKLLKKVSFFCGSVDLINLDEKTIRVSHGASYHSHTIAFDHLVLSLGAVTHFYGLPGLAESALTMKSLGDAMQLRNQMISLLEEADFECCKEIRHKLLTFVVAGGGFAGVETVAAVNDFLRDVIKYYPNIRIEDLRVVLVNSGKVVLPELDPKLGVYAGNLMESRGIEVHYSTKVSSYSNGVVTLTNGCVIECSTLVWTAGTAPHPLIEKLPCKKEKGKILVSQDLRVAEYTGVWALGDCAAIPNEAGGFHPPTAQHAIREARTLACNIKATLESRDSSPFRFKTLGQLASLGHRKGVAQVCGFRFSGFIAWVLWRAIYLMKLPRIEKRVRVTLNWLLDILFSKDNVQLPSGKAAVMRVPLSLDSNLKNQKAA